MTTETQGGRPQRIDDPATTYTQGGALVDVPKLQTCVQIKPDGRQSWHKILHFTLDSVPEARAKLAEGRTAWVKPGDVAEVTGHGETE